MNYRHSFHAGNFADLVKHALVLWLVSTRQAAGPLTVFDTHAGAGLYDLSGDATRSKEAEAGVARLMTDADLPPLMQALADRVAALNPDGGARFYPGSPLLIADALGNEDRYVGYELNPPVRALLDQALAARPNAEAREGDGYALATAEAARVRGPLILIDPPFEKPDDYVRSAETALAVVRRDPTATVAIWTPLKDLETFDGFIRRLQAKAGPTLVAEARLRPLTNPMKMNGCALVIVNPPPGAEDAAQQVCAWVADRLGDPGGRAEIWSF
ncbi:23S rRNA (adenine(2030)-N(6))-methyltransferase RlmJ [Brevundimonas sp. SL130]|uniref:23S rRNA (adenine(2030)-N(6))-methyltransferase RlmJ n=1 Tax=Brevundimonas sp. SL130 TaxID=2995143 RepID=UPI00226D21FC|nr:23S rRNA (adenine(2030)-N(6))-methyltransferase RlmJ [Brevundimonas sp. SL130]WAC61048.1 23S rRNA (adenine(2030)-N(6))-methyltransferase RlmJ [Brevundimonas sp. SL130]